jgi:hypothetical protein
MTIARLLCVATLTFLCSLTVSASAVNLAGTWVGSTDVPDVGSDQVVLVIEKDGTGYRAIVSDSAALIAKDTPARDLKLDGDTLSFWFPLADGPTVAIQLTVSGDTMSGGWQHEGGQTGSLSFERKKDKK